MTYLKISFFSFEAVCAVLGRSRRHNRFRFYFQWSQVGEREEEAGNKKRHRGDRVAAPDGQPAAAVTRAH